MQIEQKRENNGATDREREGLRKNGRSSVGRGVSQCLSLSFRSNVKLKLPTSHGFGLEK